MTDPTELEQDVRAVFCRTFNVPPEKVSRSTRQSGLQEWDSLGQLRLIMELEETFNISFMMEEISTLDTFDKILENIKQKKSGRTGIDS